MIKKLHGFNMAVLCFAIMQPILIETDSTVYVLPILVKQALTAGVMKDKIL